MKRTGHRINIYEDGIKKYNKFCLKWESSGLRVPRERTDSQFNEQNIFE